jgi:hypothetical protein
MTKLEDLQKEAREDILRCHTDALSVLLSMPAQHRCDRPRCGNLWVVDTQPPVCKMFHAEKYADTLTARAFRAGIQEAKEYVQSRKTEHGKLHGTIDCSGCFFTDTLAALDQKIAGLGE